MRLRLRAAWWPLLLLDALALPGILALSGGVHAVAAQTTQAILLQRRDEYRSAKATYDAARSAYRVAERPFSAAMNALGSARAAGDRAAVERGLARVQDLSGALQEQARRRDETKAALDSARTALIGVIEIREEELVQQMDAATSAQERNDLNTRLTDLNRERQTLEAEAGDALRPEPVVMPDIVSDPRDGPDETRLKAEILERFATTADTLIQETGRQIKDLQARLRRQQQRQDFMAGAERFDDTRVPVVTNAPPGGRGTAADSTGVGARPLTLQERIEALQDYVKQLETYRDQALVRAREFRRKIGSVA